CGVPARLGLLRHRPRNLLPRRQPHRHRHRARTRAPPRRAGLPRLSCALHHDRLHRSDTDARSGIHAEVAMSYLALTIPFLAVAVVASLAALLRQPAHGVRRHLAATAITIAVLVGLTAVFDTVMIGAGLFHYSDDHLAGLFIGLAPIEDFAYPVAVALMLPALWWVLTRRERAGENPRVGEFLRQAFVASRPVSWVNTAFPFAAAMLLTIREIDPILVI